MASLFDVCVEFEARDGLQVAVFGVEEADASQVVLLTDECRVGVEQGSQVNGVALQLDFVVNQRLEVQDFEVRLAIHDEESGFTIGCVGELGRFCGQRQGGPEEGVEGLVC